MLGLGPVVQLVASPTSDPENNFFCHLIQEWLLSVIRESMFTRYWLTASISAEEKSVVMN